MPQGENGSRWVLAAKGQCVDGRHVDGENGRGQERFNFISLEVGENVNVGAPQ